VPGASHNGGMPRCGAPSRDRGVKKSLLHGVHRQQAKEGKPLPDRKEKGTKAKKSKKE